MDIINIISIGAISIQAMLTAIFVIINKIEKRQDSNKLSEPDSPLLLTIEAMEAELDELRQNNAYMKHIQKLEEQIKEAKAHTEALSKVAGNYGSTMEEVEENMRQTVSKCRIPNDKKNVESESSLEGEEKKQASILNKIDESNSTEEVLDVFDKELTRKNR